MKKKNHRKRVPSVWWDFIHTRDGYMFHAVESEFGYVRCRDYVEAKGLVADLEAGRKTFKELPWQRTKEDTQ